MEFDEKLMRQLCDFDRIPDVVVNNSRPATVNIMIPSITKQDLTAGPMGILHFGYMLACAGINVRCLVCFDVDVDIDALRGVAALSKMADMVEFEYLHRRNGALEINENDVCVATLWVSAYVARAVQAKCRNKKFIYMIQDHETIFYPNSSTSALVANTYEMEYNAIFSTDILKTFFHQQKIGRFGREQVNCTVFDTAALPCLMAHDDFVKPRVGKKQFAFYGRPKHPRNCYELGLYIIKQAIKKNILNPDEWDFISIGADNVDIPLVENVTMRVLPYMAIDEYRHRMSTVDLCLSLMQSPHPSMVPIDLALSGAVVVTNTYANKTEDVLQQISKNILAANADVESILAKLAQAVGRVDDYESRYNNARQSKYCTDYTQMFNGAHLQWIKNLYPGLGTL